jgi:hypothetical protein
MGGGFKVVKVWGRRGGGRSSRWGRFGGEASRWDGREGFKVGSGRGVE